MTHDNGTYQIVVNAQMGENLPITATLTGVSAVDNNSDFIISGVLMTTSFIVDEVSLWHRTLNQTEIEKLYNGGVGITYPF
jgi:hypothetical protein